MWSTTLMPNLVLPDNSVGKLLRNGLVTITSGSLCGHWPRLKKGDDAQAELVLLSDHKSSPFALQKSKADYRHHMEGLL